MMSNDKRDLLEDLMFVAGAGGLICIVIGLAFAAPVLIGWGACNIYWCVWAWIRHRKGRR
jgi:hypothetical protein